MQEIAQASRFFEKGDVVFGHFPQFGDQRVERRVEGGYSQFVAFADPHVVFPPVAKGYNQLEVGVVTCHCGLDSTSKKPPNCREFDCTWQVVKAHEHGVGRARVS